MTVPIAEFPIRSQRDVARAVRRARMLALLAGLRSARKSAFAKAVGEIADNALRHAGGGTIAFCVAGRQGSRFIEAIVRDEGRGIANVDTLLKQQPHESGSPSGLLRAKRAVDRLHVESLARGGTAVRIAQSMPEDATDVSQSTAASWAIALASASAENALVASVQREQRLDAELTAQGEGRDWRREFQDQKALNKTLELLALVASKTHSAVLILDAGNLIEWANDAFTRMTGYEPAEVVGRSTDEILHGPQTDAIVVEDVRRLIHDGQGSIPELAYYAKDGRMFWAWGSVTPVLDEAGRLTRSIVIFTDASKRRQAQKAIEKAKAAAEAASRAKSEFLANISHEIRTPMNAIIGMTELALCTELTEEQREYLTTVRSSAESLLGLLNDILDLSKIESGRLELDSVPFDLAKLVADTLKTLAERAREKGLELTWRLSSDVPPCLVGDPVRLRQVLINLVGNAIKFTAKGEVAVSVDPEWQTANQASVQLAVSDTGIGIPSDRLDRIFQAFRQGDSSTTRRYGGTGLGLAISSKLVELMGGKIWVQSREGEGSTFHFTARFGVFGRAAVPGTTDAATLAGKSALVVDDNATNRRILHDTLTTWGIQPTLAESGSAAMELMQRTTAAGQPFDLVVIDAMMPEMDGFELAARIQQDPGPKVPTVLMLSSADRAGDLARCRQLGVAAYLTKPVVPADLQGAILAAFGQAVPAAGSPAPTEPFGRAQTSLNVLVADDNDANRVLASRILAKRGHRVTSVASGQEVLSALERHAFDVVVLDVQMPEIDGFATTATIRETERSTGSHVPIVAMTAYAMKGDRERCLEAGMDAYLAKPIRAGEFWSVVESLGSPIRTAGETAPDEAMPQGPFDFGPALARLEGDVELLKEQMQFVIHDAPGLVDDARSALAGGDHEALRLAAHRLRGLVGSFDATEACECAGRLEQMGREGNFEEAGLLCGQLGQYIDAFVETLARYMATH